MTSKSISRWNISLANIVSPYDFDLSVNAFGSPIPPAVYKNKTYERALNLSDNREVVVKIKSAGELNAPLLKGETLFDDDYSNSDIGEINRILEWMFDFKMDLKPFYDDLKIKDPKLYNISQQLKGLKIMTEPSPFEVLVKCMCFQMVSFPFAMKIVNWKSP